MKVCIFSLAFITMAFATSSFAHAQSLQNETVYVSNMDVFNLDLDQNSISVNVPYPGPTISGVCGIEIRADSYGRQKAIEDFLSAINITHPSGNGLEIKIINRSTLLFRFPLGGYAFWFSIETKDGSSLKQTIKDTLGNSRTVILLGSSCL